MGDTDGMDGAGGGDANPNCYFPPPANEMKPDRFPTSEDANNSLIGNSTPLPAPFQPAKPLVLVVDPASGLLVQKPSA